MANPKKPRREFETLGVDWTSKPPRIVGLVRDVEDDDPNAVDAKDPKSPGDIDGADDEVGE